MILWRSGGARLLLVQTGVFDRRRTLRTVVRGLGFSDQKYLTHPLWLPLS